MEPAPSVKTFHERDPCDHDDDRVHCFAGIRRSHGAEPPKSESETQNAIELAEILLWHRNEVKSINAVIITGRIEQCAKTRPIAPSQVR